MVIRFSAPAVKRTTTMNSAFPPKSPTRRGKCNFRCPHFLQLRPCSAQSGETVMDQRCHLHTHACQEGRPSTEMSLHSNQNVPPTVITRPQGDRACSSSETLCCLEELFSPPLRRSPACSPKQEVLRLRAGRHQGFPQIRDVEGPNWGALALRAPHMVWAK